MNSVSSLTIFFTICVVSAVVIHWRLKLFWLSSILAAIISIIIFQIALYIDLGYLDPFFVIAMATSGATALVITVLVGLIFRIYRKKTTSE